MGVLSKGKLTQAPVCGRVAEVDAKLHHIVAVVVCSLQVMVTNVKSLLETVKTVEDEAARGTRALESSIDAIGHEIKV